MHKDLSIENIPPHRIFIYFIFLFDYLVVMQWDKNIRNTPLVSLSFNPKEKAAKNFFLTA